MRLGFLFLCPFFLPLLFLSCASAPPFLPSQPLATAKTLEHGLYLCHEYSPNFRQRERLSSLYPFLACMKELRNRFLFSARSPHEIFYQELNSHLNILQEQFWNQALAEDYLTGIRVILKSLWRNPTLPPKLTAEEKELALALFPKSSHSLQLARLPHFSSSLYDAEYEELLLDVELALSGNSPCSSAQELVLFHFNKVLALREDLAWAQSLEPDSNEETFIARRYHSEKISLRARLGSIPGEKKQSRYCKTHPFIHKRPS